MKIGKWKVPELPLVRKCCFCVPIWRGITIFGYVNLILSLLGLPIIIYILVEELAQNQKRDEELDPIMEPLVFVPLTLVLVVIDIAISVLLLVGTYKKRRRLLQIYFYLDITVQVHTFCLDLAYLRHRDAFENIVYFFFFGLNVYLLFLVYCAIRLLEEPPNIQYVVHREVQE